MTIEDLFGTLQQSVVSSWRKHLKTHKYSNHMALNDFYEEMPEKVDALIEAWMGVNGKKVKGFNNIVQSSNMGTLKYLKELRSVCKQGYSLMNGEKELEALLDDIVELIDSTLYKVRELNEGMIDLADFIKESMVNESAFRWDKLKYFPNIEDLATLLDDTMDGSLADTAAWDEALEDNFHQKDLENYGEEINDLFNVMLNTFEEIRHVELPNVASGALINDNNLRKKAGLKPDKNGQAVKIRNNEWLLFVYNKPEDKLSKESEQMLWEFVNYYESDYTIENF